MEFIENNNLYTFLPEKIKNKNKHNIYFQEKIFENDIFQKYKCSTEILGEIIISNELKNINNFTNKIIKETYEEYIQNISLLNLEKDKWIYNIIDGFDEQESILYKDQLCIIIPSFTWINKELKELHILCIPLDKSIRCIRSLEGKHIELLKYMKNKTLKIIKEIYDIDEIYLKVFLHYEPSTYHLHIHFIHIDHQTCSSSIEYSYDLDSIIYNLSIKDDYYQSIILNKRCL